MNFSSENLLVYGVTPENISLEDLQAALENGVTLVQLRAKNLSREAFLDKAIRCRDLCHQYGVPLIINDDVTIAKECQADGVHLGQEDMPVKKAREILGDHVVIGASAHSVKEALQAEQDGADYLGVGAVFPTGTKPDAQSLSLDTLKEITKAVNIPCVAIGGITFENMALLKGSGIAGVAVVSAIFAAKDIGWETRRLKQQAKELFL